MMGDNEELGVDVEYLQHMINMAECGMLIVSMAAEPVILYANKRFYNYLQYSEEEYREKFGDMAMATVIPEEKQKIKALVARQTAAGGVIHLEVRVSRKDGTVVWINFTARKDKKLGNMIYQCSCLDITTSKAHLEDAYKAKKDLDLIANNIPGGVIKLRMSDFRLLYANDGFFRLAGYSRAEYSMNFKNCCADLVHPDDQKRVAEICASAVANRGVIGMEYRILAKGGAIRWSYVNGTRIDNDHGDPVYLCVIVDITSRKLAEEELADNNHRAELVTRMLKETIWTYDVASHLLHRAGNLTPTYSPEAVLEEQFDDMKIRAMVHPEDYERFLMVRDEWLTQCGEHRDMFRICNDRSDYQMVEVCATSEAYHGKKPERIYGITRTIDETSQPFALESEVLTASNQVEDKLLMIAKTARAAAPDDITGLLPYTTFLKRAERMLAERGEQDKYAIVCADINEFRKFAHHYGFSISNQILKIFSTVLLDQLSAEGMCSRVDGDYFVVLFRYQTHKELMEAMSALRHRQEEIVRQEEMEDCMKFGSTVGVYLVQNEDRELMTMLEKADLARRSIKGLVGNHYAIYTDELMQHQFHLDEMEEAIRRAMQDHSVDICYLPRVLENKESVVGCKAIPRISLENGQYMDSQQIMHNMERRGRLEEFSFYILNEVAKNLGAFHVRGHEVIPVSVEMTASQLSTTQAVNKIQDIVVHQNGLEPKDFIFEIPERYFADRTAAFDAAVRALCALGYQVVISRFGADHTAIHTIRHLPITGIKFHGEYFTAHMVNDKETIILQKIVEMADAMGLTVTCGGIQTHLQEEYARKIGIRVFEGDMYYGAMRGNVFEKCFLLR